MRRHPLMLCSLFLLVAAGALHAAPWWIIEETRATQIAAILGPGAETEWDIVGAAALGRGTKTVVLVRSLRPAMKLYLWITYQTKDNAVSKPSNRLEIELVDAFANK